MTEVDRDANNRHKTILSQLTEFLTAAGGTPDEVIGTVVTVATESPLASASTTSAAATNDNSCRIIAEHYPGRYFIQSLSLLASAEQLATRRLTPSPST